ncbi:MAG: kelch repeat-containing protein, partial [Candidatus Saccharibacteria bacterium]
DGSVGTCVQQTSAFTTARYGHTSVAYNGYLYVIGGTNGTLQNDIQHCPINGDGSVGTCVQQTSAFTTARQGHTSVAYNGYLYVIGGYDNTSQYNDIQYLSIQGPAQAAHYERVIDIGRVVDIVDSIQYTGTATCGAGIQYATAGSNGTFGSLTTLTPDAVPGTVYALTGQTLKQYVRVIITLNDQSCGGASSVSDLTVNYTLLPPTAPTLSAPASGAVNVSLTPLFQFKSSDALDSYVRYKVLVYQADCSTLVRTIDQTSSQTGWSGQDAQTSTAYVLGTTLGASTLASHTYQSATLSYNATYCWKAAAIDPGGSNGFGSFSATQLFTTNLTPTSPTLSQPSAGQTGVSTTPELRLYSTDPESDYIKYKIEVCSTSNCSSVVRTIDQTSSQTGWASQSQQSATAYLSGQTAIHAYQATALAANTQYWWRAYAIDPAGTNTFSGASGIGTFTTQSSSTPNEVHIKGNVNIGGNVIFKP